MKSEEQCRTNVEGKRREKRQRKKEKEFENMYILSRDEVENINAEKKYCV